MIAGDRLSTRPQRQANAGRFDSLSADARAADGAGAARAASSAAVDRYAFWILAALVAVGALLRLIDLGTLSYRWDEDLSSLAAKGIAMHGVPELPSGMIYLRGLLFLYALAGSGMLLGFEEWALRLPAALFGIAMIPVVFLFVRMLFGTGVALFAAALVTFSVWDIEFSRYARMYAPFMLAYVLTLHCIWRYMIVERSTSGGLLAIALALVALSLHQLAYTLAFALLLPVLLDPRATLAAPRRAILPLAGFASVVAGYFVWARIQDRYFNLPAVHAAERIGTQSAELPTEVGIRALESEAGASNALSGVLQTIASRLRLPDLPALSALAETMPIAAYAAPLIALTAAAIFLARYRRTAHWSALAVLPLVAVLSGLQLFNVALLLTMGLAFARREGVRALRSPDIIFALLLIATFFALWLAATIRLNLLGMADGGFAQHAKEAVRQLLNYPSFFVFWGYPREYPLMSIPALIGALWAFDRAARPTPDRAALFVLAAFLVPIVLNGMFDSRYQNFRYNVPFGTLYFTFVALGVLRWRELADAWRASWQEPWAGRRIPAAAVTALLVAAVVVYDMNPLRGWLATQRAYSNEGRLHAFFDLRSFRDYRSAAEYVAAHANEPDRVISFDCREYYNYLGEFDYCLVSSTYREGDELIQTYVEDGALYDLYIGTPMIMSAADLEQVLDDTDGTAWLLASDSIFNNPDNFGEDFLELIGRHRDNVVHVARDGATKVYRFDPSQ